MDAHHQTVPQAPCCPDDLPNIVRVLRKDYERNLAKYLTYRVRSEDQFGWVVLVRVGTVAAPYAIEECNHDNR